MKILFVTTGGITRFFRNWPEILLARELVARGHTVDALTYLDPYSEAQALPEEEIEGIHVRRIAPRGWYSSAVGQALAHLQPDLVHIFHLRNYFAFQAAWHMQRRGIPVVVTPIGPLHDPYLVPDRDRPLDSPPRWNNLILSPAGVVSRTLRDGRVKRHIENYLMHWPVRHADAVIACSEHERLLWQEIHIPSETIPLWIDTPFVRAHASEHYPTEFEHPLILFVAQLKYRKGFDILAQAMPCIVERFPRATFIFVSHNPARRAELERLAGANGTIANLQIIERLDEQAKVQLYHAADVLAFPTRYEGFGLPLLEAMAAGCPVVTSDIPVVDEIVTDGENGLRVPRDNPDALGQAILRVLEDRPLRDRLVANGFQTLNRFAPGPFVSQTEAVYARALAARRGR